MKQVHSATALFALILLPVAGSAQQNNSARKQNQAEAAAAEPLENATPATMLVRA
jgi:hypothetical protein